MNKENSSFYYREQLELRKEEADKCKDAKLKHKNRRQPNGVLVNQLTCRPRRPDKEVARLSPSKETVANLLNILRS